MKNITQSDRMAECFSIQEKALALMLAAVMVFLPMSGAAQLPGDSIAAAPQREAILDVQLRGELPEDSVVVQAPDYSYRYGPDGKKIFNPDPTRAVWLSALFPGLGQVYNRRYWKLPIIVGGFMGLGYAVSWNNGQYNDYTQAYRDITDSDPSTDSYKDFFPPTTNIGSLDRDWLTRTLQSRKNYYRRNRDLCIICIAALYLLCMVDAYVDASMAHFDISPDLSVDVAPALILDRSLSRPAFGLNWAFNF